MSDNTPVGPRVVYNKEQQGYVGVCEKCHYRGPLFSDRRLAVSLLRKHVESRTHKTNFASPNRFTV